MKKRTSYFSLIILLTLAFLSILVGLIGNLLTNDNKLLNWLEGKGIGTEFYITALVVTIVLILLLTYLHHRHTEQSGQASDKKTFTENTETNVKRFFGSLKERYEKRYRSKLDGRFEITLEVSENREGQNVKEFKGEYEGQGQIHEAFEHIQKLFKREGRFLILGNPGVGKTVLLLKLALELLKKTDVEKREAFPVIFNLASWSYDYENFEDWLISVLNSMEGLSRDFAGQLLREERIVFLLDGLDEIARNLDKEDKEKAAKIRADCLQSLNDFLDRGKKAVICSREKEFAKMHDLTGKDAPVSAKVTIHDLSEAEVLNSLMKAQQDAENKVAATNLLEIVKKEENKEFLKVLSTPFYFTTALEVFDKQILEIGNFPKKRGELENYLLMKFIKKKLNTAVNPNRFRKDKMHEWLNWLACLMERRQTVTFELTDLKPYKLISQIFFGITVFIIFFLVSFMINTFFIGLSASWVIGIIAGVSGIVYSFTFNTEENIRWNFRELLKWKAWITILITTVLFSTFFGLLSYWSAFGWFYGSVFGFHLGCWAGVEINCKENVPFSQLEKPYQRIRASVIYLIIQGGLILGVIYFSISVLVYKVNPLTDYWILGIQFFLGFILGSLLRFMYTPFFVHLIIRFCLFIERKIPLKYATFLDYAAEVGILEKVGGHWRFRHQNLQDFFAELDEQAEAGIKNAETPKK